MVIVDPSPIILAEYGFKQRQAELERGRLTRLRHTPSVTLDGQRIELLANIEQPEDTVVALEAGDARIELWDASRNLDVIGHNIANANTVGMKASRAEFGEIYASSINSSGSVNAGIGVQVAAVAQQFTQGNTSITNNPLDVAINGEGFFRMNNGGFITYTRNGQFQLDKDGYLDQIVAIKRRVQIPVIASMNGTSAAPPAKIPAALITTIDVLWRADSKKVR